MRTLSESGQCTVDIFITQRIIQTEENMERFTGKGAQSIRDQAEKSIKSYKREIDEMKAKLKMLREASEN